MSFFNQTPEALLGRSDSKNPATTCRGLTTAGKPCRRSLASSKIGSVAHKGMQPGVVAVVENDSGRLLDAAFYCWQHKDQATNATSKAQSAAPGENSRLVTVTERTSIDSLAERLGVIRDRDISQHGQRRPPAAHDARNLHRVEQMQRRTRPATSPVIGQTVRHDASMNFPKRKTGFFSSLCCFASQNHDDGYYEIVRHRRNPVPEMRESGRDQYMRDPPMAYLARPAITKGHARSAPQLTRPPQSSTPRKPVPQPRRALSELPSRSTNHNNDKLPPSPTQQHLSHIPRSLSPETTALLLTELSKPISPHDEAGYIYIFWLTATDSVPDPTTASSLLQRRGPADRDLDALARTYSKRHRRDTSQIAAAATAARPRTILLKIGRANNVHRRMNEWTAQCGHALSLVRWYPHVPSSSSSSGPPSPLPLPAPSPSPTAGKGRAQGQGGQAQSQAHEVRKVPHVHRVERLIHLELGARRVKRGCEACGREHREWFEVEASEGGVRAVDEVVRRWTRWSEGRHGVAGQ